MGPADYVLFFDAFLVGLTATPDNRTYGVFKNNVVSDYSHEKAVADGVNVGNEVYTIETEVTTNGPRLVAKQSVEKREKLTYKADEDPKSVLAQFRNDYYPRIAVTVDSRSMNSSPSSHSSGGRVGLIETSPPSTTSCAGISRTGSWPATPVPEKNSTNPKWPGSR